MITINTKTLWERERLNLTVQDLNEFDDPLDNILQNVMIDYFFKKKERDSILAEK